jgi:hypothetical protein
MHEAQTPPGRLGWKNELGARTLKWLDGTNLDGRGSPVKYP